MMDLKDYISRLESSDAYRNWDKKDYYLIHLFNMTGHPVQAGFYSQTSKKAVSFEFREDVAILPESDILREGDADVEKLECTDAIGLDDAIKAGRKAAEERYPHEHITKEIMLFQSKDGKPQFNLTLLTASQRLINMRLDSKGELLSSEMHSLMDFAQTLSK
jgi:hypothetical protein